MRKIGLLGGTFDPPHYGHLAIAEEVYQALSLDAVWFLPANKPPHKEAVSFNHHRKEMVDLAIRDNDHFHLCTIEFEREGPSYTYETVRQLQEKYRDDAFYFIIGGDMINHLSKWYRIDDLLKRITFVGVNRPGVTIETPYSEHIIQVEAPQLAISSSLLRERFQTCGNTRYYVPESVRQYIKEHDLYGTNGST